MALDDFPTEADLAADAARPLTPVSPQSEDLFDFPRIVAFADGQERVEEPSVRLAAATPQEEPLERSIDRAAAAVSRLVPCLTPPGAGSAGAEASGAGPAGAGPGGAGPGGAGRADAPAHPAPVPAASSSRPLWALAAAALLLNVGFFTFLWQNSRAFEATLLEVRAERAQSSVPPALAPRIPGSDAVQSPPLAQAVPSYSPREQQPMGFEPPEEVALRLAREELTAGRFAEARRRLFALLANIDGLERARREPIEARASFLLAETFRDQALQLAEARL
jgi:hypothetical protein